MAYMAFANQNFEAALVWIAKSHPPVSSRRVREDITFSMIEAATGPARPVFALRRLGRFRRQVRMVARSVVRNFLSRLMCHSRLMASLRVLQHSE